MVAGCPFSLPLPPAGDNTRGNGGGRTSAGKTLYNQACAACHPSAASLVGVANLITTDTGTVNPAMSAITLTAPEVANLQAYLASLSLSTGNNGNTGGASAGQTFYGRTCIGCHPSAASIAGAAGLITTNMGTVNAAMTGITLTTQQVVDLQAYLATPFSCGAGLSGEDDGDGNDGD